MGRLIPTGVTKGIHKFELDYREVDGTTKCITKCACGFEKEIISFNEVRLHSLAEWGLTSDVPLMGL
jgi:hypothetical protein